MNDFEDIKSLSDVDLEKQVMELSFRERKATVKLLWYLKEFDTRKIYLELGYSSLYDYCVRRLKLSDGAAYRRITACRALKDNPEISELIVKGELSLTSITAASKCLRDNKTTVKEIAGKSSRELEKALSVHNPVVKPKEVIKPLCVVTERL